MSHRLKLIVFAIGCSLATWLVLRTGLGTLLGEIQRVGWLLVPVVLVYAGVYALFAAAWNLVMNAHGRRISYGRAYMFSITGYALNIVTPLANLGGEAFKGAAVAPWLGRARASSSIVIYWTVHAFSNMVLWVVGLAFGLVMLPHTFTGTAMLSAMVLVNVVCAVILVGILRRGLLGRMLDGLERLPLLRRLAPKLESRRPALLELDSQVQGFWRESRGRFAAAVGVDLAGRCLALVEFLLILRALDPNASVVHAFLTGSISSLLLNLMFFVPLEAGSREGSLYLIAAALSLAPQVGIFVAVVTRLRELVWVAVGLLLIWVTGSAKTEAAPEIT